MAHKKNKFIKDFDESKYLELNPDVSEAVENVRFSSGWGHYLSFGIYEDRPGKPANISEKILRLVEENQLPCPPPKLRTRVHGQGDLESFNRIGRAVAINLELAMQSASIKLRPSSLLAPFLPRRRYSILDFGCGCGRTLSWFQRLHEHDTFYGTDIDNEAISWCKKEMSHIGTFICNDVNPPLPLPDEYFDFIYSISVFTHLPEDMQFAWLEELNRVAKRGSYLILTTHGEDLFPKDIPEKDEFEKLGFYYAVGEGTEGLPNFYQTAYHTKEYVRNKWSKYFKIKDIINRGLLDYQDIVVCMKSK